MKNQQQILIWEFVIMIALILSFLTDLLQMPREISQESMMFSGTIFLVLLGFKIWIEGSRTTVIFFITTHCFMLYSKNVNHTNYIILSVLVLLLCACFVLMVMMPIYKLPTPTGIYSVGFNEFVLGKEVQVSVYYPIDQIEAIRSDVRCIKQIRGRKYLDEFQKHLNFRKFSNPPCQLIRLLFGSLYKSTINVNPRDPISQEIQTALPIIFANGIGSLRDHYSYFLREWASQGHVVFALQFDEDFTIDEYGLIDLNKDFFKFEKQRSQWVTKLIDTIYDEEFIKVLLRAPQDFKLNYKKLTGAGHSFGACTMFYCSTIEKRIQGGLMLYDPIFQPLPSELLQIDIKIPLLCVNSESFKQVEKYECLERNKLVFQAQVTKPMLCVELIKSDHLSFLDIVFLIPFELKVSKQLRCMHNILDIAMANLSITNLFLNAINKSKSSKMNNLLQSFKQHSIKTYQQGEDIIKVEFINNN